MKLKTLNPSRLAPGLWIWLAIGFGSTVASIASTPWTLQNGQVELRVESRGAIVSDLRLTGETHSWLSAGDADAVDDLFGHFLCFDRWGPVTPEERAAGLFYHGAAARVNWTTRGDSTPRDVDLTTTLPVVGLRAERAIHLPDSGAAFQISTTVLNPTTQTRPFNVVEHITLAETWNDPRVRLHTNATTGIVHYRGERVPEARVRWPELEWGDERWDLRGAVTRRGRMVASLVFPDDAKWAWVCVADPVSRRVLGYVWRTADLPWLNLFWQADGSRVVHRAVEPGTTGLHRPMPELQDTPPQLGRPVVSQLRPDTNRTFEIWGFAARMPDGMGDDVMLIRMADSRWEARDRDGHRVELHVPEGGIL